jgi:hypothetical protein
MASERPSSMGDIPLIPFLFAKHYLLLKFLCIWGWATGGVALVDQSIIRGLGLGLELGHIMEFTRTFRSYLIK